MASIYANLLKQKEAFTFKKRSQLPKDYFGTPTRLPFHCFGTVTNMDTVMSCENALYTVEPR